MECRFVFSAAEIRQASTVHVWTNRKANVGWTAVFWAVFFLIYLGQVSGDTAPDISTRLLDNSAILLMPVFFCLFFFTPAWGWANAWYFRRSPLYNQDMVYSFDDTGFQFQTPVLSQRGAWSTIGKAGEGTRGFILFSGKGNRSFHWLPKHGFASPQDIDAFRALLQRHVPKFKAQA
jgi:hypothetical protein